MWWSPKEPSRTNSEIRLVHKPHAMHVPIQGLHQAGRQHSAPVLVPITAAHRDAVLLQATAIQQLGRAASLITCQRKPNSSST